MGAAVEEPEGRMCKDVRIRENQHAQGKEGGIPR